MPETTIETLQERVRDGDEGALADLFSRFRDRLWRIVQVRLDPRLLGRVDPDDVLQEAYLDAASRIAHFPNDDAMTPFVWLRLIVGQTLVNVHRRHLNIQMRDASKEVSIHGGTCPQGSAISMADHLLAHLTSPSQAVLRAELVEQLERAIERMDPIDREVLVLRHDEELSNREIAEVLGIHEKTASMRYIRAIQRLKDVLSRIPGFFEEVV